MSPEASATLAARAMRLTSTGFRRDLVASLHRILAAAAGEPSAATRPQPVAARPPCADGAAMPGRADAGYAGGSRIRGRPSRIHRSPPAPAHPAPPGAVRQYTPLLAGLASRLVEPGPVPVRGAAIVSRLLADGTGPLSHQASRDDLGTIIEWATHALTR